mgnify:CR=1 FL=1
MRRWVVVGALGVWLLSSLSLSLAAEPPRPHSVIDPTISLGVILHLLSLVVTIIGTAFVAGRFIERQKRELFTRVQTLHDDMIEKISGLSERLTVVESRTSDLWTSWKDARKD